MSLRERELLEARYWSFYDGFPIPQWIEKFVGSDVLDIYVERYSTTRWVAHWWCVPCAIELEHRRAPIHSLRQLRQVAARVRTLGYDFVPAIQLSEDITQENWSRYLASAQRMSVWNAATLRRQIEAMPATVQLRKELEAKNLPQDAAANLALMRAIVGLNKDF
jgi:hypothetical protein